MKLEIKEYPKYNSCIFCYYFNEQQQRPYADVLHSNTDTKLSIIKLGNSYWFEDRPPYKFGNALLDIEQRTNDNFIFFTYEPENKCHINHDGLGDYWLQKDTSPKMHFDLELFLEKGKYSILYGQSKLPKILKEYNEWKQPTVKTKAVFTNDFEEVKAIFENKEKLQTSLF